jgi:hypothetical protein
MYEFRIGILASGLAFGLVGGPSPLRRQNRKYHPLTLANFANHFFRTH